jgi:hypothetical protein
VRAFFSSHCSSQANLHTFSFEDGTAGKWETEWRADACGYSDVGSKALSETRYCFISCLMATCGASGIAAEFPQEYIPLSEEKEDGQLELVSL